MSEEKIVRAFKGIWIPKEVWLDENLKWMEKLLLVEINSLDNEKGCFASNNYFAKFFKKTPGRISQLIKSLEKKGKISVEYIKKGKEITGRVVRILNTPLFNKLKGGSEKIKEGYLINDEGINTKSNNTNINNTKEKKDPLFPSTKKEGVSKIKESKRKESLPPADPRHQPIVEKFQKDYFLLYKDKLEISKRDKKYLPFLFKQDEKTFNKKYNLLLSQCKNPRNTYYKMTPYFLGHHWNDHVNLPDGYEDLNDYIKDASNG